MKNALLIKFILTISITINSLHAQTFNKSKLDSLLHTIETKNKGMGTVSIFAEGKEVYNKSFGFSNLNEKTIANNKTKYRIGSVTKTFTAAIIMQLVDEGKLNLNTFINDFLPEVPNSDSITIEDLLRHQSGLYNITDDDNLESWIGQPQSRIEVISRIIDNGIIFQPQTKTQYSNTNYILLSFIAEIIENKKYAEILETRIIDKLKLNRTEFGKKINPLNNEALAYSLDEDSNWQLHDFQTDLSTPMGAGSIVSTPTEINIFYNALFSGKLISEKSLNNMKTAKSGMGLGLMKLPLQDMTVYGHGGSIDGFQSFAAYFIKEKTSISLTTNGFYNDLTPIFIGAVKIYFGMDYQLPDFSPKSTILISPEELQVYIGLYNSPDFPQSITISSVENILNAQVEGQPNLELKAIKNNTFYSEEVMLTLKFIPEQKILIVEQGDQTLTFTKE